MSTPYIGEIRMGGWNFAPAGWAQCAGQLVAISDNDTLFALIGTTYGGDGQVTFGLPDLRGRGMVHQGQGPGLPNHVMGEQYGQESVTLGVNQLPSHTHTALVTAGPGVASSGTPTGRRWHSLASTVAPPPYAPTPDTPMSAGAIGATGGSQPHENLSPYLTITHVIALFGIFPPRN